MEMTLSRFVHNSAPLAGMAAALALLASCSSTADEDAAATAGGSLSPAIVAEAGSPPLAPPPGDPATPLDVVAPKFIPVPAIIVAEAQANVANGRAATAQSGVSQAGPVRTDTVQAGPGRAAIQDDPDRLLGLEQGRLTELFGNPSFVRQDAPAALWRYRSNGCIVDLYLYPAFNEQAQAEGPMRVRHVEVRAATGGKTDVQACLSALIAQQPGDGRG
jgi:hypothetical protein